MIQITISFSNILTVDIIIVLTATNININNFTLKFTSTLI